MSWLRIFYKRRPGTSSLVLVTFALTLFFFTPVFVFLHNSREIYLPFNVFCLYFLLLALSGLFSLRFLLNRFSESLLQRALPLLLALSILFWIQVNLLPWEYGTLDGSEIDWSSRFHYGLIDTALWIGVILIFWHRKAVIYRRFLGIGCAAILLIQILGLAVLSPAVWNTPSYKRFVLLPASKFSLGLENNVVILVLDSFPSDLFQEIIEEEPSFASPLEGFSYFRNAAAEYPFTETSIFNILTGERFDFGIPFQRQLQEIYLNKSLLAKLRDKGYVADVFPPMHDPLFFAPELLSNIRPRRLLEFSHDLSSCNKLLRITGFVFLPHFAKIAYYPFLQKSIRGKLLSETWEFNHASFGANRQNPAKVFKYFHLPIPHRPLILNESLDPEVMPFNRENFKRQAKGALQLVKSFLKNLKKAGGYDQTIIWIVGDHGAGAQGLRIRFPKGAPFNEFGANIYWWQANGIPLVLAKPFGSKGPLKVSDTSFSLRDIRDTTLRYLQSATSPFSTPEFPPDDRERSFFLYTGYDKTSDRYILKHKFQIKGHSWDSRSWIPDYAFNPGELKSYAWGETIRFGKTGNAERYKFWHGFSAPEEGFTWTEGNVASMGLRVPPPQKDLVLKLEMTPLIGGNTPYQEISLRINGRLLETWRVKNVGEYTLDIPRELVAGEILEIVFHLPNAVSPKEIGINRDERLLAVAIKSLVIEERDTGRQ